MSDGITIVIAMMAVCIVALLALAIVQQVSVRRLKKRVDRFMGSRSERHNIEEMLLRYLEVAQRADEKCDAVQNEIHDLRERLQSCVQGMGLVRYNPFREMGGDLCFALALLDGHQNGVVINTIHGRDASYTYAKAVVGKESDRALSQEETEAIALAMERRG